MADRNLALQLLITAKDQASSVFTTLYSFLDRTTSATANKIREAFSNLFGGGLQGATDFEAAMTAVIVKGDDTYRAYQGLKERVQEVGNQFGVTGTEAASAMETLSAASLSAKDAVAALPAVLSVARIENINTATAATKLTDALSSMGMGFDQIGHAADVLAKGSQITTSTVAGLADGLKVSGGVAKAFGMTLEDTIAALDLFAKSGVKGSEGGQALKEILNQLVTPTSQASVALAKLGIDTRSFGALLEGLKGKSTQATGALAAFGESAGPNLRLVMGDGRKTLDEFHQQLLDTGTGAVGTANAMSQNLDGAMKSLSATWDTVKTTLLTPVLGPLADAARDAAQALKESLSGDALKAAQGAIREFATQGVAAIRDFLKNFDFTAAAQTLQTFATGCADAFGSIRTVSESVTSTIAFGWNSLTAGFKTIAGLFLTVAASTVQTLSNIESAASKIGLGTQERANALQETANNLMGSAQELLGQVGAQGAAMGEKFTTLGRVTDAAATGLEKVGAALPTTQVAAHNAQQEQLNQHLAATTTAVEQQKDALNTAITAYNLAVTKGEGVAEAQRAMNDAATVYRQTLAEHKQAQDAVNVSTGAAKTSLDQLKPATAAAQTGLQGVSAGADAAQTGLQAVKTGADAAKTGLQAIPPAATSAQTGIRAVGDSVAAVVPHLERGQDAAGKLGQGFYEIKPGAEDANAGFHAVVDGVVSLVPPLQQGQAAAGQLGQGFYEIKPGAQNAEAALLALQQPLADNRPLTEKLQEKTTQLTGEITRIGEASNGWHQGMQLNALSLASLRDLVGLTAEKLDVLQARQKGGEKLETEVAQATAAAAAAYGRYNQAVEANVQQQENAVAAAGRALQLGQQEQDLNLQRAQTALNLARIQGDATEVQRKENDLLDAQVSKIQAAVQGKNQEIAAYQAAIAAVKTKLEADGQLDVSDQAILQAMADKQKAMELERDSLVQAANATRELAQAQQDAAEAAKRSAVENNLYSESAAAVAARNKEVSAGIQKDLDDFHQSMQGVNAAMIQFREQSVLAFGLEGIGQFNLATEDLQRAIRQANDQAKRLADEGLAAASGTADLLAEDLLNAKGYLSDAAHTAGQTLKQALADARQEAKGMADDLATMAQDFEKEILQAQGNKQKLEELDYQEKMKKLEELHQKAGQISDDEYRDAVDKLNKLHALKLASLETEQDSTAQVTAQAVKLQTAWTGAAEQIERANAGLGKVATTDLSKLEKQLGTVKEHAEKLASVL